MQKIILKYCISAFLLICFTACNWFENNSTNAEPSANSYFQKLAFTKNDSIPGLETAVFTLVYDSAFINGAVVYDSTIVNLDSLPYNTDISRVVSTFAFASTKGAMVFYTDSLLSRNITDTVSLAFNGKDTLNFYRAMKIRNYASDGKDEHHSDYLLKVNVHKVKSELYVWNKIKDQIFTASVTRLWSVYFKGKFFIYAAAPSPTDANEVYLYTSTNGIDWTEDTTDGLSALIESRNLLTITGNIVEFDNKLYVAGRRGNIHSSVDGYNWEKVTTNSGFEFRTLLCVLNGKLWAITSNQTFASSPDGVNWTDEGAIPENFPVDGFASLSFASATKRPKALIVGGYTKDGAMLKNVWSTENGTYWVDFSRESNNRIQPNANASLIKYNDRIFLFGGKYSSSVAPDQPILESLNDGLSWSIPDSANNTIWQFTTRTLPPNDSIVTDTLRYEYHSGVSAFYVPQEVAAEGVTQHYIYLIGGAGQPDVWRGKLNKLSFKR
ncbi:MAG: DUF6242 domain-containing protein [Paludibacter sp.]|jgi:hypothetical protein|nr:DUF6242 domain-containing protein [Paludibacter sp.]